MALEHRLVEFDQGLAGAHHIALRDAGGKAFSLEHHRVDADV